MAGLKECCLVLARGEVRSNRIPRDLVRFFLLIMARPQGFDRSQIVGLNGETGGEQSAVLMSGRRWTAFLSSKSGCPGTAIIFVVTKFCFGSNEGLFLSSFNQDNSLVRLGVCVP